MDGGGKPSTIFTPIVHRPSSEGFSPLLSIYRVTSLACLVSVLSEREYIASAIRSLGA